MLGEILSVMECPSHPKVLFGHPKFFFNLTLPLYSNKTNQNSVVAEFENSTE